MQLSSAPYAAPVTSADDCPAPAAIERVHPTDRSGFARGIKKSRMRICLRLARLASGAGKFSEHKRHWEYTVPFQPRDRAMNNSLGRAVAPLLCFALP